MTPEQCTCPQRRPYSFDSHRIITVIHLPKRVKLEDLVKEITSKGRTLVPDSVKRELLIKIKDFLAQQQNI